MLDNEGPIIWRWPFQCRFEKGDRVAAIAEINLSYGAVGVSVSPVGAPILRYEAKQIGLGCSWTIADILANGEDVIINTDTVQMLAELVSGINLGPVKISNLALDLNYEVDQVVDLCARLQWPAVEVVEEMMSKAEDLRWVIHDEVSRAVGAGLITDGELIQFSKKTPPMHLVVSKTPRERLKGLLWH